MISPKHKIHVYWEKYYNNQVYTKVNLFIPKSKTKIKGRRDVAIGLASVLKASVVYVIWNCLQICFQLMAVGVHGRLSQIAPRLVAGVPTADHVFAIILDLRIGECHAREKLNN